MSMDKELLWENYNDDIGKDLIKSSKIIFDNGCSILEDSRLLFDNGRFPRATTLAILAEEEISKAFICVSTNAIKRWDNIIYSALKTHQKKHTFALSMTEVIDEICKNISRNRFSFFPLQEINIQSKVDTISKVNIKKCDKKEIVEKLKQKSLYVSIDKDAKISSLPTDVGIAMAVDGINRANFLRFKFECFILNKFEENVESLFTKTTTLNYNSGSKYTIFNSDGCTITIDLFKLIEDINIQDCNFINLHNAVENFAKNNWASLSLDDSLDVCKLIKHFKIINQITSEWLRMGFRGTPLTAAQCHKLLEAHHV
jgi:AbiV family abortive infection protein